MGQALAVFRKELLDALRDRRTLFMVLLSSVALGPVLLALLSTLMSNLEKRAEAREVMVVGLERAPTLRNYLERQTFTVRSAPQDYAEQLADSRLREAVVVVPEDFERALLEGQPLTLEVVSSSSNQRAQQTVRTLVSLLGGFNRERGALALAVRGVPPSVLQSVEVQERDLASPSARAAQFLSIVPFFVLMAVLYGALSAALDTTAGERERGSLEPLLMNPATPLQITLGKWAAVATVGMMIAVLSCMSFLPGQWLIGSELLSAMFRFGPQEAVRFIALLAPLACGLSAVLMALAIRCKSFKEAQANVTVVVLAVSMLPLVTLFNQGATAPWYVWVPALGQLTLMDRVLKGEALAMADVGAALAVCVALAVLGLLYVARTLRAAAIK
jgi:sodium transport system permease protein